MPGADRVRVVVVMPALAAGEDGDPPVVAGVVAGFEAALAVKVRGGVDEPGGVQADDDAEECSPEHHAQAAHGAMARSRKRGTERDLRKAGKREEEPVELREPDVDLILGEVGSVAAEERGLRVHGAA